MTRAATPRLARLAALAALAAFLSLLLGRVELLAVAAPIVVALAAGAAGTRRPEVDVDVRRTPERCSEGDVVEVVVGVRADDAVEELDVGLAVPPAFRVVDGSARTALTLAAGERRELRVLLRAERWGAHGVGVVALRAHGPGRLSVFERVDDQRRPVRVLPALERLVEGVRPSETQTFAGNHRSRAVGEGIEFASVRPYARGDSVRRVNWRVTSRRGELHVNEHHLERNADVVLFLDTFGDVGPPGRTSLDLAVRGAATLARHELAAKDRVGVVGFGGTISWLAAGMGQTHLLRVLEAVLDVNVALSYAWKDVEVLPRRALPPLALFVALSPLLDRRALAALVDLRARGYALTVIETLDEAAIVPLPGEAGQAAHRLWRLGREGLRSRLAGLGIPVVPWSGEEELAAALARVPARVPRGPRRIA